MFKAQQDKEQQLLNCTGLYPSPSPSPYHQLPADHLVFCHTPTTDGSKSRQLYYRNYTRQYFANWNTESDPEVIQQLHAKARQDAAWVLQKVCVACVRWCEGWMLRGVLAAAGVVWCGVVWCPRHTGLSVDRALTCLLGWVWCGLGGCVRGGC